jgi:hypothetical protein
LAVAAPEAHYPAIETKGSIMWKELNSRADFFEDGVRLEIPSPVDAAAEQPGKGADTNSHASRKRWRLGPMAMAALAVCAHPYAGFR